MRPDLRPRSTVDVLLFLLLLSTLAGLAPSPISADQPGADGSSRERPNVLLYVSDTLRADALARYGNPVVKTPNLDSLARDGTLFLNAYAPSSWTRASVASIMTGLYPDLHAAEERENVVSGELVLLSELFSAEGYATGAIVTNPNVGAIYGFDQGFDDFIETFDSSKRGVVTSAHEVVASDRVTEMAIEWLESAKRPFFLFVLAIDPHWPYEPPREFDVYGGDYSGRVDHDKLAITRPDLAEADRQRIRSLYDAEVAFNDHSLGVLLRHLEQLDVYDDTAVLFTSDHGEEFWEHGRVMHGTSIYEESVRVPLILRYPKRVPVARRVQEPVELIDISTTLLGLAGIEVPDALDGRSLLDPAPAAGRERHARLRLDNHHIESVTVDGWKLVCDRRKGEKALYNLTLDPEESWNLAGRHPERVVELEARIEARKQQSAAGREQLGVVEGAVTVTDEELPEEMRRSLEALGYIDAPEPGAE